jgi:hypothetical protein
MAIIFTSFRVLKPQFKLANTDATALSPSNGVYEIYLSFQYPALYHSSKDKPKILVIK